MTGLISLGVGGTLGTVFDAGRRRQHGCCSRWLLAHSCWPSLVLGLTLAQNLGRISFFPGGTRLFPHGYCRNTMAAVAPLIAIVLAAFVLRGMDLQGRKLPYPGLAGNPPKLSMLVSKTLTCSLCCFVAYITWSRLGMAFSPGPALVSPNFADWHGRVGNRKCRRIAYLSSFLYLSLGMALAHWRQSVAFTVGIGIGLIFFEAVFYPLALVLGQLQDWPVQELTAWTLQGVVLGLQGESDLFGAAWYIPIVAAYTCGLAFLAALAFTKFDLKAGGE